MKNNKTIKLLKARCRRLGINKVKLDKSGYAVILCGPARDAMILVDKIDDPYSVRQGLEWALGGPLLKVI